MLQFLIIKVKSGGVRCWNVRKVSTKLRGSKYFLAKTMKVQSHIHLLYKDHTNILHVQNTVVSCLPLCFRSHLLRLTLFYFKIQQAVLGWHFEHTAIVVKYLPNVSFPLHLSVTTGTTHTLLFPCFPTFTTELSVYVLSSSPFFAPPPVSLYLWRHLFHPFISLCQKTGGHTSKSLCIQRESLCFLTLFSHLLFLN